MNKKRALSDITFERRDKRMNLIGRCGSFSGSWCSFDRFFAAAVAQAIAVASVASVSTVSAVSTVSTITTVAAVSAISAVEGSSEAKVTASLQLNGVATFLSKAGRDQRHHQKCLEHEPNGSKMRTNSKVLGLTEQLTTCARRAISFV